MKHIYISLTLLLLSVCLNASCFPDAPKIEEETFTTPPGIMDDDASITVNGRPREPDAPYYRIYPGHENIISVNLPEFSDGIAQLFAILPDGRTLEDWCKIDAAGHATLHLGTFATPTEYEFDGGDVWRRGTRFILCVNKHDGRIVTMDFCQGPARREDSEALWIEADERYRHDIDGTVPAGVLATSLNWSKEHTAELQPLTEEQLSTVTFGWLPVIRMRRVIGEMSLCCDDELIGKRKMVPDTDSPVDIPLPPGIDLSISHTLKMDVKRDLPRGSGLYFLPPARIPRRNAAGEYVPAAAPWRQSYRKDRGRQMLPPFEFRLGRQVLMDQNDVLVVARSRPELELPPIEATLELRAHNGDVLHSQAVTVTGDKWLETRLPVTGLPAGDYTISLMMTNSIGWQEGPSLKYRRRDAANGTFAVSPCAPWRLERDSSRQEVVFMDFSQALQPDGMKLSPEDWLGQNNLLRGNGHDDASPAVIHPQLESGPYAVWAKPISPAGLIIYIQLGKDGPIRPLLDDGTVTDTQSECFMGILDGKDNYVALYQCGQMHKGISQLRFTPVTNESTAAFRTATENPPMPLCGVADWFDAFVNTPRMTRDAWDNIAAAHVEIGMREMQWAIGRSTVYYRSKLPDATQFPSTEVPDKPAHLKYWQYLNRTYDPLAEILMASAKRGVTIVPWLCMNRHYGGGGQFFDSKWHASHPEYHEVNKHHGRIDDSRSCLFLPEVRRERIDILTECAERNGVKQLVLDCCRQQPMLKYHPAMVQAYIDKTGLDPNLFDASSNAEFTDWITWRASHFTQLLRELRQRLDALPKHVGIIMRIPAAGLYYSMAQGLDVEVWMREGLIERLELEGAEDFGGRGSMDVRPYVALGRKYGVPVFGGVNCNTIRPPEWSCEAALRRALTQYDAGVSGLQIYESNNDVFQRAFRWMMPLLGHPEQIRQFLNDSNIGAVWPVNSVNCFSGIDNHSEFDAPSPPSYDIFERGRNDL